MQNISEQGYPNIRNTSGMHHRRKNKANLEIWRSPDDDSLVEVYGKTSFCPYPCKHISAELKLHVVQMKKKNMMSSVVKSMQNQQLLV